MNQTSPNTNSPYYLIPVDFLFIQLSTPLANYYFIPQFANKIILFSFYTSHGFVMMVWHPLNIKIDLLLKFCDHIKCLFKYIPHHGKRIFFFQIHALLEYWKSIVSRSRVYLNSCFKYIYVLCSIQHYTSSRFLFSFFLFFSPEKTNRTFFFHHGTFTISHLL